MRSIAGSMSGQVAVTAPTTIGTTAKISVPTTNGLSGVVSAPIEGVVSETPPKVGTALPVEAEIFQITNDRIARKAEAQLDADLGAASSA
ncbi:hypothetical protein [Methylorubrum extorquens]|uniref:hypothetical protein n=1 Tax=Methylorubrum extorquens TaxID=408 RepID=UPI001EE60733|nr:hypothetical protein [Methylorubrum extorquens]MCG5249482.1 hypothetical protein [Methylorubrum extorquens]